MDNASIRIFERTCNSYGVPHDHRLSSRKRTMCTQTPQLGQVPEWEYQLDHLNDPGDFKIQMVVPETTFGGDTYSPPQKDNWDIFVGGAFGAATITLIAGQSGPQVAAPEELVTVPLAYIVGGVIALLGDRS